MAPFSALSAMKSRGAHGDIGVDLTLGGWIEHSPPVHDLALSGLSPEGRIRLDWKPAVPRPIPILSPSLLHEPRGIGMGGERNGPLSDPAIGAAGCRSPFDDSPLRLEE